jgi:stearoyl-CoA desaturase (delta-9 desaturase)
MGWLLMKLDKSKVGVTDCSDIENDPMLQWQERNYKWLSVTLGLLVPWAICGFGWGDWRVSCGNKHRAQ